MTSKQINANKLEMKIQTKQRRIKNDDQTNSLMSIKNKKKKHSHQKKHLTYCICRKSQLR